MPTARPFAYNTGSTIDGTIQIGNLAVGYPTAGFEATGLQWWNGPDEDLGYVVAEPNSLGTITSPIGINAFLGFWRSEEKTDESFLVLATYLTSGETFSHPYFAKIRLEELGYWTSWNGLAPTPTPTPTSVVVNCVGYFAVTGTSNSLCFELCNYPEPSTVYAKDPIQVGTKLYDNLASCQSQTTSWSVEAAKIVFFDNDHCYSVNSSGIITSLNSTSCNPLG
jgi:hypothetical protein